MPSTAANPDRAIAFGALLREQRLVANFTQALATASAFWSVSANAGAAR